MLKTKEERQNDLDPQETAEWLEALEQIVDESGPGRAAYLLETPPPACPCRPKSTRLI
jgi:pyruvate dehydrogenase E1 component